MLDTTGMSADQLIRYSEWLNQRTAEYNAEVERLTAELAETKENVKKAWNVYRCRVNRSRSIPETRYICD